MSSLRRGDVHLVDLGMAAKVRPCLIISIPRADKCRNMTIIAPLTTEVRGGECEVEFPQPRWLAELSVINLIGIGGADNSKIGRFIGIMPDPVMQKVSAGLVRMLGL